MADNYRFSGNPQPIIYKSKGMDFFNYIPQVKAQAEGAAMAVANKQIVDSTGVAPFDLEDSLKAEQAVTYGRNSLTDKIMSGASISSIVNDTVKLHRQTLATQLDLNKKKQVAAQREKDINKIYSMSGGDLAYASTLIKASDAQYLDRRSQDPTAEYSITEAPQNFNVQKYLDKNFSVAARNEEMVDPGGKVTTREIEIPTEEGTIKKLQVNTSGASYSNKNAILQARETAKQELLTEGSAFRQQYDFYMKYNPQAAEALMNKSIAMIDNEYKNYIDSRVTQGRSSLIDLPKDTTPEEEDSTGKVVASTIVNSDNLYSKGEFESKEIVAPTITGTEVGAPPAYYDQIRASGGAGYEQLSLRSVRNMSPEELDNLKNEYLLVGSKGNAMRYAKDSDPYYLVPKSEVDRAAGYSSYQKDMSNEYSFLLGKSEDGTYNINELNQMFNPKGDPSSNEFINYMRDNKADYKFSEIQKNIKLINELSGQENISLVPTKDELIAYNDSGMFEDDTNTKLYKAKKAVYDYIHEYSKNYNNDVDYREPIATLRFYGDDDTATGKTPNDVRQEVTRSLESGNFGQIGKLVFSPDGTIAEEMTTKGIDAAEIVEEAREAISGTNHTLETVYAGSRRPGIMAEPMFDDARVITKVNDDGTSTVYLLPTDPNDPNNVHRNLKLKTHFAEGSGKGFRDVAAGLRGLEHGQSFELQYDGEPGIKNSGYTLKVERTGGNFQVYLERPGTSRVLLSNDPRQSNTYRIIEEQEIRNPTIISNALAALSENKN